MPKRNARGFTLIELMVVLVIIAVFSALAIPGITRVRYRNSLSEMVNEVQQIATETRLLAMRTRRAAVMEVNQGIANPGAWVNLLNGPACNAPAIAQRCVYTADLANNPSYVAASATMCGAKRLELAGAPPACAESTDEMIGRYALCYSGRGELFVRQGNDAATGCDVVGVPNPTANWLAACDLMIAAGDTFSPGALLSGVAIPFNRHPGRDCGNPAEDVQRMLFVPTTGAPYSKVGQ